LKRILLVFTLATSLFASLDYSECYSYKRKSLSLHNNLKLENAILYQACVQKQTNLILKDISVELKKLNKGKK